MKNKNILMIVIPILCLCAAVVAYLKFINVESDSTKFKKEYEEYNNVISQSGDKYQKLKISSNNPIKYADYNELINIVKSKTGIIYLGFPNCPWCRTALPILFEAAENNNIDTIYYKNIYNDRDAYEVQDNKLVYAKDEKGKEKKGVDGYFKLMDSLDNYLSEYIISYDGIEFNTGKKRIYAPTVVFVKDGQILGIHVATIDSQASGFDKLSEAQHDELYSIYEDYISEMLSTSCEVGSAC